MPRSDERDDGRRQSDDKPQSLRALAEMARRQKAASASAPPSAPASAPSAPPPLPSAPVSSGSSAVRTPMAVVTSTAPRALPALGEGDEADTGVFVPPTNPPPTQGGKRSVWLGSLIAVAGIGGAAALAVHLRAEAGATANDTAAQDGAAITAEASPASESEVSPSEAPATESPVADEDRGGIDLDALPSDDAADDEAASATKAAAPIDEKSSGAPSEPAAKASPADAKPAPASGSLVESIAKSVGGDLNAKAPEAEAPAGPASNNATIPKHPPQGAVQAGIKAARSAAKACVAGADAPTQANLTFGSSGAVKSVAVSGWAAENGQSACVKSAFAGVSVGAFQDSSYTAGVVVRP